MSRRSAISSLILGAACSIALIARLSFPEVMPLLDTMKIVFYLILAVTVIAVLRNVGGLITYGVFGPAIVSLGLARIGDIYWGITVFFSILAIGIITRFIMEPLKLQMVHRVGLIVIVVASVMGFFIFIGLNTGNASLTLVDFLPILVTSWIVERFVRDNFESGWKTSFQRLAYTTVATLASFLLLKQTSLINYFVYTPEMWILPVLLNIFLGVKVRVRLSEVFRFRRLAKSNSDNGGYSQILTMNLRNREYIEKYDPKKIFPRITKLDVKDSLQKARIPVAKTLAVFENLSSLKTLNTTLSAMPQEKGFVIKPNNGFGGRGILVVKKGNGGSFEEANGERLTITDVRNHLTEVLDGEYSGRSCQEKAFVEELLIAHPDLAELSYSGLPDIRVIVFEGVPVMAMARLPTKKSGGKANLHQGAIGAGIDLRNGKIISTGIIHEDIPIIYHPDTKVELIGRQIPFWDEILRMSVEAQKQTGLGYAGIDIVIDKNRGCLVMEVNKRPGLEIQNINQKPLLARLRAVEMLLADGRKISVEEGISVMFLLESRAWNLSEKEVALPNGGPV